MPQENKVDSLPTDPSLPPRVGGIAALVFLGAAAAVFTYVSVSNANSKIQPSQAAAAAGSSAAFAGVSIQAKSAYVYDLRDGKVLYEKNPDAQLPLASLTKVALALTVSEVLPLNSNITIPYDTAPKGSAMRLAKGEVWKVSDVLSFTLIASSNEGADILAQAADSAIRAHYPQAPQGAAALWRMNDLAQHLGMDHTYFLDDNGLDISTTQAGAYGSAKDYAMLMANAASSSLPVFAGTTRDGMLLTDENGNTTSAINTDEALGQIPGLIMGKTGYTDLAGGNLAVVFDVGLAHPVVAVVLGSTFDGRFSDMKALVSAARAAITQ